MNRKQKVSTHRRRTGAEVQQLVAEFVSSGMLHTEFCRSRGLSFGTLDRHLKKQRWKRNQRSFVGWAVGYRWSWPQGDRRRSTNRVAGWQWAVL